MHTAIKKKKNNLLSQHLSFEIKVIIKSSEKLNQNKAPADTFMLSILTVPSSFVCVRVFHEYHESC